MKHTHIRDKESLLKFKVLVAEFMGAKVTQDYPENKEYDQDGLCFDYVTSNQFPDNSRYYSFHGIKYDTSWSWIMPVVGKIYALYSEHEHRYREPMHMRMRSLITTALWAADINVTCEAVEQFIRQYNENGNKWLKTPHYA